MTPVTGKSMCPNSHVNSLIGNKPALENVIRLADWLDMSFTSEVMWAIFGSYDH